MLHARVLRYLDEVGRCGTIRGAAGSLNVAASAINRQIIALEQQLGTPLFERLPGHMRPTTAGEILITHARAMLKEERRTVEQIAALKDLRFQHASIATTAGLAGDILWSVIAQHRLERPFTRFSLNVLPATEIVSEVSRGEIDLGIGFDLPTSPNLNVAISLTSPCGAVVRSDHELAGKTRLRLGDLRHFPLAVPEVGVALRDHFDHAARQAGLSLEPALESNTFELLKHFALMEKGVAVLNRIEVARIRASGEARFIPISELASFSQTLSAVHRARPPLSVLSSQILERLRLLTSSWTEG